MPNDPTLPPDLVYAPLRQQVPLAAYCTLAVGGRARRYLGVRTAEEVLAARALAQREGWAITVLGGGSNVVISDQGLPGLVLQMASSGHPLPPQAGSDEVWVAAGECWDELVKSATARNWAGLECLSGIPGQVGAAPIQNIGAYGQEVSECITAVRVVTPAGKLETLSKEQCEFGYRQSVFKRGPRQQDIVVQVALRLSPGGPPTLEYPALRERLPGADPPSLSWVRETVLRIRSDKSMVRDPNDPNARSCGSFFVNPVLSKTALDALRSRGPQPPVFPGPPGRFKVPAAWLLERAGFRKGQRWGRCGLSQKHALALVTEPGASASDVAQVARRLRDGVREAFGITLQAEPRFLGFPKLDESGLPHA